MRNVKTADQGARTAIRSSQRFQVLTFYGVLSFLAVVMLATLPTRPF